MTKKQKWILRISIGVNIIFLLIYMLNYTAYSYKLGMLTKDVKVGVFNDQKKKVFFTLPKGLTVRDVSERGLSAIGQFENNRFNIVVTSDDDSLVNYNIDKTKLDQFGNLYSADLLK